jgi:hypothetical protein
LRKTICPICNERVPFGGGQTVQNSHRIGRAALTLREAFEATRHKIPVGEVHKVEDFIEHGIDLGTHMHKYAHKGTTVPPDFAGAGRWMRAATAVGRNFGLAL